LAEEVAILSRAETELHAGRYQGALRVLEEYERKFHNGKLAQERAAARILALCGLGRTTEANAALARLSRGSLHAGTAREACAKGTQR
jgi:RNA polymerase sigma-70 factor (ECF subfamily)